MILMALDHTRDFFGYPGQNPTNLASASPALFLTRWVTHFCARSRAWKPSGRDGFGRC